MNNPLSWRIDARGDAVHITLKGVVNEDVDLDALIRSERRIVLDAEGLEKFTSAGIRNWLKFIAAVSSGGREVALERCSVVLVQQLNMVSTMRGNAKVNSIMLPYHCGSCRRDETQLLELRGDSSQSFPEKIPCKACGKTMLFDDLPEHYLSFLDEAR